MADMHQPSMIKVVLGEPLWVYTSQEQENINCSFHKAANTYIYTSKKKYSHRICCVDVTLIKLHSVFKDTQMFRFTVVKCSHCFSTLLIALIGSQLP